MTFNKLDNYINYVQYKMYHNQEKFKPFYMKSDIMKASKHLYVFIYSDSKHAFVWGGLGMKYSLSSDQKLKK